MMSSPGDHFLHFSSSKKLEMHIQSSQTIYSSRKYSFLSFKTMSQPQFKKKKFQIRFSLELPFQDFLPPIRQKLLSTFCAQVQVMPYLQLHRHQSTFSSSKPVFLFVCFHTFIIIKVFDKSPWILEKTCGSHFC